MTITSCFAMCSDKNMASPVSRVESDVDRTENETTSDSESVPRAKKTKFAGSYKYKCKFKSDWTKKWPFIVADSGNANGFRCTLCGKNLNCSHQGIGDVEDHIATKTHQRLSKERATSSQLSFLPLASPLQDKVIQ